MKKIFLALVPFVFVACQKTSVAPTANNTPAEAPTAAAAGPQTVNLAIWGNYVTDEMLADFQKQTGIKVEVSNYASNEELLAKLQAGASGYDVAVPSDYMVKAMADLNLLEKLDRAQIPNAQELDAKMLGKYYDTTNEVSLPWSWGTTGIAYNTKSIKTPIRGWKDLLENKTLSGKFTLLDDVRETLGAALKSEALSLNTQASPELAKAKKALLAAKSHVKGFNSETLPGLLNGEMAAAHAYSCDALQAQVKTNGAIQYVLPEEGFTLWIDNLVIPKGALHKEAALKLINYFLSASIGAARAQNIRTAPANVKAIALLPKELQDNKALFPDATTLAKAEMIQDVGESLQTWDRIWTEVKAAK